MFCWAPLPEACKHMSSVDFALKLINEASVAVAPGAGFGERGDGYVRIALVENEQRIRQAARNIKRFLQAHETDSRGAVHELRAGGQGV